MKTTDRYLDRWSVEIAEFQNKTKDLFEWKQTLKVGDLIDAHDKTSWNKSTILEIKTESITKDRQVILANIGFRVYQENGTKNDKRGQFEGLSDRFDEWVGIFSPRVQPYLTKTLRGAMEDQDLDDINDNMVKPIDG